MPREPAESTYDVVNSPVVGEFNVLLWVPTRLLRGDQAPGAVGTTLAAFMVADGVDKGDALDRGYGGHVLSALPGETAQGWVSFWFCSPRLAETAAVPFRTYRRLDPSVSWPRVLITANLDSIQRYIEEGGGDTYEERVRVEPIFKEAYNGPTLVRVEEYFGPVKFAIPQAVSPQPQSMNFDHVTGQISIAECLHPTVFWSASTGTNHPWYPLISSARTDLATNLTDWPNEMTLIDAQRPQDGGWLRRREVALRPDVVWEEED